MTGRPGPTLGVVGTFVLDRIVGLPGRPEPTEELGGIAYGVAAVLAALPTGWRVLPIVRIGTGAGEVVEGWLTRCASSPHALAGPTSALDLSAIVEVPVANNRVELRYHDAARRTERLSGGVGAWPWEKLSSCTALCDALLVNFVSGHELSLDTAQRLRASFPGPIYADLHSLFLDTAGDGTRVPRPLPQWPEWVGCFDAVQMNEAEFDLLRGAIDMERAVRGVVEAGPSLVARTIGERGAECWSTADALDRLGSVGAGRAGRVSHGRLGPAPGSREWVERDVRVEKLEIPAEAVVDRDPTGCGDVWGATMFCNLLAGASVERAGVAANRLAAVAGAFSGVEGLVERFLTYEGHSIVRDDRAPGT